VAWLRAIESVRRNQLFDDPYARSFVAAATDSSVIPTESPPRVPNFYELMAAQVAPCG
jgi:O-methyltransferase involved in polyketide biosynthesis